MDLVGFTQLKQHQHARDQWVGAELEHGIQGRDSGWTESLAVGSDHFVQSVKRKLGMKGRYREVSKNGEMHMLREPAVAYSSHFDPEIGLLSVGNGVFWEQT